ncbi:plasmid stabilization system protein ParE [Dysgonomonas hofstadii]|uniref:Plasmid stabilization system protein ParE n=1 Tax=Dysgonomonas hofstadii TaxID=637886 RepID=A0A840CSG2_9BACT|nr:type II toxin-antitoxin system RelE/ParE family toxin [Dysgonomonas hofstadii]MBB4037078.1 plasmid stabilization system protein ParE [Dysgonomonas hofstadii]
MVIKWLAPSRQSLKDIVAYYKKEYAENAALKLITEIRTSVERLKEFPELAAVEPLLMSRDKTYRSLVVTKTYKVIYYIENDIINISDIWDCRQSPETNKKKIKE